MPHRDQRSSSAPETAENDQLVAVLREVFNQLVAAGLDVHMALELIDRDTEPALWMHSVVARLDTVITTILRAGLAPATNSSHHEPRALDTFDALACGLTGGFDLPTHLRTIIDPSIVAQAERILAERHHISIADAVIVLGAYAHCHDRRLPDVARAVIDGTVDLSESEVLTNRV